MVETLDSLGFAPALLVEGLDVTVDQLRDGRRNISWDLFVAIHENLAREAFPTRESRLRLGGAIIEAPGFRATRAIAATLVTPRLLYRFVVEWVGPSIFPHLRSSLSERDDGQFEVTLEIPPPYRDCVPFLELAFGGLAAATTLLGAPSARMELEYTPRMLRATLAPPPVPRLRTRLIAAARAILGTPRLLAAVREQGSEITDGRHRLLRSHGEFHELIERMADCVVVHRGAHIVYVNRAGVALLGYDGAHQLIGRPLTDLVHPDQHDLVRERMSLRAPTAELPTVLVRMLRRDGTTLVVEVSPAQLVDFDGQPARIVVGRDRTEQLRTQEQLVMADRMASLGMLAAGIAHEINNPLAYVKNHLELAAIELSRTEGSPATLEAITAAREGIERVRAIVSELKSFSRVDREVGSVPLDRLVGSTVSLARKELELRARVVVAPGPSLSVRGNASQLGQVLLDLLLNAAESVPADAPEQHEIRVEVRALDDDLVALEVIDTGVGIPEAARARIFEPFFTTKPLGKGTGLGLSICHRIVNDLGGRIEVESTIGRGSTFRVVLPRAPAAAAAPEIQPPVSDTRPRRARILLVDDEPQLRRTLALLLRERHDVEVAADGREAQARLREAVRYDVVVCDLMMSGVDGVALYDAVDADRPALARRFLFMTGGAFTARASEFLARVPVPCLEKPFDLETLLAAIDERLAAAAIDISVEASADARAIQPSKQA